MARKKIFFWGNEPKENLLRLTGVNQKNDVTKAM